MKILHIAPNNTAGVPITMVRAERALGHDSRLVTLQRDPRGYEEDLCLELPGWEPQMLLLFRRLTGRRERGGGLPREAKPAAIPPRWKAGGPLANTLIKLRDRLARKVVIQAVARHGLDRYDVYQLDGGHGFLKYDNFVARWHAAGKKVICCYLGSDLRVRGVMPGIEAISDCNVSCEWDHLDLHPKIEHVWFPFDASSVPPAAPAARPRLRIGHSPSNRKLKGSDRIIAAVENLAKKHPVDLVLIEGLPHAEALGLKATCDIGVDQLGDLGYGISALEWLAMAVPVATSIARRMASAVTDHPFIAIDEDSIETQLERLILDQSLRRTVGEQGQDWLRRHHDAVAVVKRIHQLAGLA